MNFTIDLCELRATDEKSFCALARFDDMRTSLADEVALSSGKAVNDTAQMRDVIEELYTIHGYPETMDASLRKKKREPRIYTLR